MLINNDNCYVTLDEANEYFSSRLGSDYWDTTDDTVKEKALITATKNIDKLPFTGCKQNPAQPLEFPRMWKSYRTDVPQQVKDAVCEEALCELQFIANNGEEVYNGALESNYQSLKLGEASITYAGSNGSSGTSKLYNGLMSKNAAGLLQGLIKTGFNIENPVYFEEN